MAKADLSSRGQAESLRPPPSLEAGRRCPERCPKATLGSLQLETPLAVAHQRGAPARSLSPPSGPVGGDRVASRGQQGAALCSTTVPEGHGPCPPSGELCVPAVPSRPRHPPTGVRVNQAEPMSQKHALPSPPAASDGKHLTCSYYGRQ